MITTAPRSHPHTTHFLFFYPVDHGGMGIRDSSLQHHITTIRICGRAWIDLENDDPAGLREGGGGVEAGRRECGRGGNSHNVKHDQTGVTNKGRSLGRRRRRQATRVNASESWTHHKTAPNAIPSPPSYYYYYYYAHAVSNQWL